MSTFVKTTLYIAVVVATFCIEYDIPIGLYYRRAKFLTSWKIAAYTQRKAMQSYSDYVTEVEASHG